MTDQPDPLATVRAALDDVRAWCVECDEHVLTDGNSGEHCDWLVFIYGEEDANAARDTAIDRLVDEGLAVDDDAAAKMVRVVTLIPAAPAIADLCREVEALRAQVCRLNGGTAIESDYLCRHNNEEVRLLAVIADLRERLNATREELRDATPDEEA